MIGYNQQFEFLKNKYRSGQLGHAYLLSGPDQIGKEIFAREFIKFINCTSLDFNGRDNQEKNIKSCGECQNCKMIEKEAFPDLLVVDSRRSESSIKNEKDMMSIEIEQIRQLQHFLSYKSFYGGFKTVIINDAERMTLEAQNCFLKNLEEPKGKTIIFLISSKPILLLPTIISRCQEMKFLKMGTYKFSNHQQEILKNVLSVIQSDLAVKFQYVKNINLEEGNLHKVLEVLERYFRDLLLARLGVISKTSMLENKAFAIGQIKQAIKLIERLRHQSSIANVNPKLALEIILMEI